MDGLILAQKAGEHIHRLAAGTPVAERNEHDPVTVERIAVPTAMLANESAIAHGLRQRGTIVGKDHAQRRDM
jgi:hypothetical protein